MTPDDYTEEMSINTAAASANELESRLRKDISGEVRDSLRKFFEEMKEFYENILRESSAKQDQTIEILKDRLLSQEALRTELGQDVKRLEEKLKTVLQDNSEGQAGAAQALKEKGLTEELNEAANLVEAALKEKTAAEKRAELALLIADEAEKKFNQANKSNETLNTQLNFYKQELNTAVTLAESFFSDKIRLENKLAEFQEYWEKHLANSQDKP